jgi:hypothetical protein
MTSGLRRKYNAHINSAKWRNLRREVVRLRGLRCERCGRFKGRLCLHHKTYARFGNEALDQVELLCCQCHKPADKQRQERRVMALTDKSAIALKPSDFKIIEGERRLSDVRLAERLGFEELNQIRHLGKRWQPFLEQQSGKVVHRERLSGARGFAGDAFWWTIPEVIFIAGKSEARNADVVQYEAAVIAAYWLEGIDAPVEAAPILLALTAPDRPRLLETQSSIPVQAELFAPEPPRQSELFAPTPQSEPLPAHNANQKELWIEEHDGIAYHIVKERNDNGDVCLIDHVRNPPLHTSTDGYVLRMPWINGQQVQLRLNHVVPLAVVERSYLNMLPDGEIKNIARQTLHHFLAL